MRAGKGVGGCRCEKSGKGTVEVARVGEQEEEVGQDFLRVLEEFEGGRGGAGQEGGKEGGQVGKEEAGFGGVGAGDAQKVAEATQGKVDGRGKGFAALGRFYDRTPYVHIQAPEATLARPLQQGAGVG